MQNRIIWALVGLNVVLLISFVGRMTGENTAIAQARRPASDYIMIPGEVSGGSSAVLYVIDTAGQGQLSALAYDASRKELNNMPPIDLGRVFESAPSTVVPPAVTPRGRTYTR